MLHIKSLGSAKIISLDVESVREKLKKVARNLNEQDKNVLSVWLFGSLARGDALPGSDADILIVLRDSALSLPERMTQFMDYFAGLGLGIDIFPLTEKELEEKKNDLFWKKVLAERLRLA